MPELPEVENYRRFFEEAALHQPIAGLVKTDAKILKADGIDEFTSAVTGRSFTATSRVGKYLFAKMDNERHVLFHFGLTGDIKLISSPDLEPRFTRVMFQFDNGACLAFTDLRKFGKLELLDDPVAYCTAKKIGPDAWGVDKKHFVDSFKGKSAPIKSLLLEQKNYAGIGNWIADEMLFRATVHPATRADKVSARKLGELHQHLQAILDTSVRIDTNYGNFPDDFFATRRSEKSTCPTCDGPIKRIEVGGRGTYVCASCQKKK